MLLASASGFKRHAAWLLLRCCLCLPKVPAGMFPLFFTFMTTSSLSSSTLTGTVCARRLNWCTALLLMHTFRAFR